MRAFRWAPCLLPVLLLLSGGGEARGQEGAFAFQIRGGQSLPLGAFRDPVEGWEGKAGQGQGFDMGFTIPAPGPFGALLGFGQRRFGCDPSVCPEGKEWVSTGFDVALRLVLGEGKVRGWIQGGLHTHRLEGKVLNEDRVGVRMTSDGGGGVEVGGGLLFSVGERTSLSPGVRYGWGRVPFPTMPEMGLRYLVADLGIVMGF